MDDVKEVAILCTNVDDLAIGVVLMQEGRVFTDKSHKLNYAKLNYQIHEKELLAGVCSLKVCRRYLLRTKLKIEMDQQSFEYLSTQPYLSRRQCKWMELLQE